MIKIEPIQLNLVKIKIIRLKKVKNNRMSKHEIQSKIHLIKIRKTIITNVKD